jgi:hypothetical protein
MSGIGKGDLGVLGELAEALGIFVGGSPNTDWFANPDVYLRRVLANAQQRAALLNFVDEALGGADNTTEQGVIWVPLVKVPDLPLTLAMTVDESRNDGLYVGVGLKVVTGDPASVSTLSVPLFCARKDGASSTGALVLLGSARGRIKVGTQVTVSGPALPGQARLGAIGVTLELPTGPGADATFGFSLTGLQMPGAATPIDINVQATSVGELDDALLQLVLSLVKAQSDAPGAPAAIVALGGLLGLKSGDNVPDFPITQLPSLGVHALSAWVLSIVQNDLARNDWLGHIGSLLGGTRVGAEVRFALGLPALTLALSLPSSTGASGHTLLTPRLTLRFGDADVRVEAQADLMSIDLITGQASALPAFSAHAASGRALAPVLDVTPPPPAPAARAETLRIGFAIDAARKLTFVLAADNVTLGSTDYPVLDLTSPDAVMDAVGNTVADIANELLAHLGDALASVQQLLGLAPPAGIPAVTLPALMSDPVGAVAGYWQTLIVNSAAATTVLQTLRQTLADASQAGAVVAGAGTDADPWRLPLIGPLALEAAASGSVLTVSLAAATSVDTLGQRCTVVSTRVAAMLARIDLAARSAQLMLGAEASLHARERGVNPPQAKLELSESTAVLADEVGLKLSWAPTAGLRADVSLPNPRLVADGLTVPLALPVIGADGLVTLPPLGWDAVQVLVGHLAGLVSRESNFFGEIVVALGWQAPEFIAGGSLETTATLRLADLVSDAEGAIKAWLPKLLASDLGPRVLSLVADLLAGSGDLHAVVQGRGTPQDPYRFSAGDDLPEPVLWFPPAGLEPLLVAAPQALRDWRPGLPALAPEMLEAALRAEALAADDVADLIAGRVEGGIAAGIDALVLRFAGGDGRIAPPLADVPGVDVRRLALAAGQLWPRLDIENTTGRVPTTTVHVALGAPAVAWPDAPADRLVDLSTAGLEAAMFSLPAAATGDWFVALGTRAACLLPSSSGDGTAEQAARLARWLAALAPVSNDIALAAVAGAGHAARLVADAQAAVTDLVLLGTPLAPISLTTLQTQPAADVLRLMHRLLPPLPSAAELAEEPLDAPLELGHMLVRALMELEPLADAGADLRPPAVPAPATRAGLAVTALFGSVSLEQAREALTAIVASGLAARARARVAATVAEAPTGVRAGLRWRMPVRAGGTLAIDAHADLCLLAADLAASGVVQRERVLTVRLVISDRAGWLAASPTLSLRAVSLELTLPLDGAAVGSCKLTLHEASVFGQSWERLRLGTVPGLAEVQPVLPEARVLLASLVQRLAADVGGPSSVALADVLEALGLIADAGGVVANAVDQLVHDPGGLIRHRMVLAGAELQTALAALLGPLAIDIDWATHSVAWQGGSAGSGRFGWTADVQLAPSGATGSFHIGPDAALPLVGGVQLRFNLQPFSATLQWHHAGGGSDSALLWPAPDAQALARMLASATPALAAQVALEGLRRADDAARPLIDGMLDAFGFLSGAAADAERSLRPLAGFVRDPLGWLGSSASLAAQPVKIQGLFDAVRPLMGLAGAAGTPLPLAPGVSLAASAEGGGARLALSVDPSVWTAADPAAARLAGGIGASLVLQPGAAPGVALGLHLGLAGVPAGQQAVHVNIGSGLDSQGVQIFLRPSSGADIPLLPFAGLGALSSLAAAALPYLLDRLAERPAPVGPLVAALGDALLLRSAAPAAFSSAALQAWAVNPVDSLRNAATPMVAFGLQALADALDAFVPADINVTHSAGTISVSRGAFTLGFAPSTHALSLACNALPVPGIQTLTAALVISDLGLRELSFTLGPAAINAGGVLVRPFVTVAAGDAPAGGARVLVGLAGSAGSSVAARWLLSPAGFAIVAADGQSADAADFVAVLIDLAAAVALAQPKVDELLDSTVSGTLTVRNLLRGVVLADVANPDALINDLFVPAQIPLRVRRLFKNLAEAVVTVTIDDFSVAFMSQAGSIGLQIGLASRLAVPLGEVTLWIENDDSWITSNPSGDGGLFVGFLNAAATVFQPKLVVNGLGLRLGKSSGPLIDAGLTIESVALHVFADIGPGGVTGAGVQLQFANLAVPAAGAGGDNGIAQGLMRDTGPTPPQPTFSPALAVQKHGNGSVAVSLRAGDPPGPWWIAIQKGFGPLYLEQVGFDARLLANGKLERVSVLMDGSVSLFGLTCAVDDLQVTYFTADGDFLNAANWKVDLAGLAVAADMAGLSIAGGLLKQETTNAQGALQTEYLGMLLGRFAVYGLTIYGGYGEGVDDQGNKFTAFFAIGAVNGPIGGPPAFFLTGIGGGFGINRLMKLPTDLSKFGDYPLIQALDIAASPSDPMQQLRSLGSYFPMSKGTFWFAAGLSFNSFALVDGIAVVGVQIGDGLDINLMGLARMALPRPQVALVSIEVALIVRFSSSEGVLWVQGQLTDNSWLLYEDIKLTGGFAYVIWFKGERAGEFVLTLGGYHPDFKRAGYPVVPRLGLRWSIGSSIVIKAGSYFALTSEALMAGGDFEASATLGPAWAEVKFGAHGIVYFDPFSYSVSAYARIAAGVTLDLGFFGEITFSINIGARIQVEGPDFRGSVTFEIGPLELTFEFGGSDKAGKVPISADAFVTKYLERADSGAARAHALMTSFGALPSKGEDATPDGSAARPFVVVVEFGLTFTTTVPAVLVTRAGVTVPTTRHDPSRALAVGPMGEGTVEPEIVITWQQDGAARPFPFAVAARPFSRFPVGVWGPAGDMNNRKVPKADMVEALSELDMACVATPTGGGPEIPYFQVEIGKRLPLPFARAAGDISALRLSAKGISALVVEPTTVDAAFGGANKFLARTASPTALAALRGERQAPPRLGTLAEGLESPTKTVAPKLMPKVPGKVYDHVVDAPRAVGLFAAATVDMSVAAKARTTVKGSAKAWRVAPPTLAAAMAERSRSVPARLLLVDSPAVAKSGTRRSEATFVGAGEVPLTAMAHAPTAIVARTGAPLAAPLAEFNAALAGTSGGPRSRTGKAARRGAGAQLAAGECVVLKLPNAKADAAGAAARPQLAVAGAPARVVLLDIAGRALADVVVGKTAADAEGERLTIPRGTECIVAIGQGLASATTEASAARAGLAGWHAGLRMPYVGHGSAIGPGCIVHSTSDTIAAHGERAAAGWVSGAELARGITTVNTRFAIAPRSVIVVVDDPAVTGRQLGERRLLLGLDGADRATDAAGVERAPVLMTMDNRSLLAYEVVPDRSSRVPKPVQVSVASDEGWSLVAVMATSDLDPQAALNLIAARGLQAALTPLAPRPATASDGGGVSRLDWIGPVRSPEQQRAARARASGVAVPPAPKALSRRS